MVLVGYSDSEGSDAEEAPKPTTKTNSKTLPINFTVDKANPQKIRVNLTEIKPIPTEREDGEPAAKRPRIGGGAFSGFNAMLPAPKRDNLDAKPTNGTKSSARKVFSLRTGAEPAFDRTSDNELKQLFAEQERERDGDGFDDPNTIPEIVPRPQPSESASTSTTLAAKPFMFKPLSVGRNQKKKKSASQIASAVPNISEQQTPTQSTLQASKPTLAEPPKKTSLFSVGPSDTSTYQDDTLDDLPDEDEDEIIKVLDDEAYEPSTSIRGNPPADDPESLDSIANSLNLSAAERRQLLGRNAHASGVSAAKIVNFNTDVEYAANQASNHAGEQVQHNPVRSIAPGKHSLKQLVASAQGQKEALEESFATGRRNKKEAGTKYGW